MAQKSKISISGLYQFDNDIFSDFSVPNGMDKDTAINYILSECQPLEVIYPDSYAMKQAITDWSRAELPIWQRMWDDANLKYNPLWNVDGTETETHTETIGRELEGTGETSGTGIDSVKGYNDSEGWADSDKTGTESESKTTESEDTTRNLTITKTRGGNIGVTMTQQLLNADLDLLPRFNIYNYIMQSFKNRFCLEVY